MVVTKLYMSQLNTIIRALQEHNEAIVTNTAELINLPKVIADTPSTRGIDHDIFFYVAPKKVRFDAEDLNRFMDGLIQALQPSNKEPFKDGECMGEELLYFGRIEFYEEIGFELINRRFSIIDEYFKDNTGFKNGSLVIPEHIRRVRRRIGIEVYPYEGLARLSAIIYNNKSVYHNHYVGCATEHDGSAKAKPLYKGLEDLDESLRDSREIIRLDNGIVKSSLRRYLKKRVK